MPRAIWKGDISFGLVNIPVQLLSAESKRKLSLDMLDKRDKARIQYKRVNAETGKEVPWDDIVKGYEYDDGEYVLLTDKDFENASVEATQTIGILDFIEQQEIDARYYDKPYYLVPGKRGAKGYVLLRRVMEETGKAAIGRVVIRTKERLVAVYPRGDALILNILRFDHELRDPGDLEFPDDNLKKHKISAKEVELAEKLVDSMTSKWKPEKYKDEYYDVLMEYIEKKAKTGKPVKPKGKKEPRGRIIDMKEMLEKSVKGKSKSRSRAKKRA